MILSPLWQRRLMTLAAELLLVVAVVIAAEWWMTRAVERGVPLQLQATTLDGQLFDLQQWRGRKGIIYFWAEWCPVCRANRHVISSLADDLPVMTIAMQSGDAAAVSAYMVKEQFTLPTIVDEEGAVARRLHIGGVPFALVIDREGRVSHAARGYTSELGLRFRLWLAK